MGHHRLYGCFFYKLLYPSVHSPVRSFVSSLGTNNEFTQKYNIILFYSRAPLLRTSSFTPAQPCLVTSQVQSYKQAALLVLISMTYALCIFTDNRKLKQLSYPESNPCQRRRRSRPRQKPTYQRRKGASIFIIIFFTKGHQKSSAGQCGYNRP